MILRRKPSCRLPLELDNVEEPDTYTSHSNHHAYMSISFIFSPSIRRPDGIVQIRSFPVVIHCIDNVEMAVSMSADIQSRVGGNVCSVTCGKLEYVGGQRSHGRVIVCYRC